jgi:hypothetical protein
MTAKEHSDFSIVLFPSSRKISEKWGTPSFIDHLLQCGYRVLQTRSIAGGVGRARRAKGARLPIRQIAPQNGVPG